MTKFPYGEAMSPPPPAGVWVESVQSVVDRHWNQVAINPGQLNFQGVTAETASRDWEAERLTSFICRAFSL